MKNNNESSHEAIQITAKFPWATNVVETISCHENHPLIQHGNVFEVGNN